MRSVSEDSTLFPPVIPRATHRVETTDGHNLYVEDCGNPEGIPVVFLHGGPGSGITATHRRLFDPSLFRVILFDQRGSGQSRPFGSVEANTTWTLIDDMELIRKRFDIDSWIIFGGSWGSTLGLAYAINHPDRVLGLVLRGIFLGTRQEIDWFLYGMEKFYPEAWDRFVHFLPEAERGDLLKAYGRRLLDPSPSISIPAAEQWSGYENSCATLRAEIRTGGGRMALSLARLEAHYFLHGCFLEDGYILDNMENLAEIPGIIIQGRHDVICPPHTASDLAKAWPGAELRMVDDAGHSAFEPGVLKGLISAMATMAEKVSQRR
ncbi:MAG: prolyl aminopeptidase [Candidatus Puniceispirillales bacterium]